MPAARYSSCAALTLVALLGGCSEPSLPTLAPVTMPADETQTPPLGWVFVDVDARICAIDERHEYWCWRAYDLEARPVAVEVGRPSASFHGLSPACLSRRPAREQRELPWPRGVFVFPPALRRDRRPEPTQICELDDAGGVRCAGPLDSQTADTEIHSVPPWSESEIELVEPAVELAVAGDHACARHQSGRVSCWTDERAELIEGLDDALALDIGPDSACAWRPHAQLSCWPAWAPRAIALVVPRERPTVREVIDAPSIWFAPSGLRALPSMLEQLWLSEGIVARPPSAPRFTHVWASFDGPFAARPASSWPCKAGWDRWMLDWAELEFPAPWSAEDQLTLEFSWSLFSLDHLDE